MTRPEIINPHIQSNGLTQTEAKLENWNQSPVNDIPHPPLDITQDLKSKRQDYVFDDRMFAHIHGDAFTTDTDLEGNTFPLTANTLLHILRPLKDKGISIDQKKFQSIITELESFHKTACEVEANPETNNLQSACRNFISQLQCPGNALTLPGGWSGTPSGHAMIYRIVHEEDSTYSFSIYNTGSGVDLHYGKEVGNKFKYHPAIVLRGIKRELLEDPLFFEALIEPQVAPIRDNVARCYNANFIYLYILEHLKPASIDYPDSLDELMTPQRSGTCAWKSLMAYMRARLSYNDYKYLKFHIKLQTLRHMNQDTQDNALTEYATRRHLLKEAAQLLAKQSNVLIDQGIISIDELHTASNLSETILKRVNRSQILADTDQKNKVTKAIPEKQKYVEDIDSELTRRYTEDLGHTVGHSVNANVPISWFEREMPEEKEVNAQNISRVIQEATLYATRVSKDPSDSAKAHLRHFIKKTISHLVIQDGKETSFWKEIKPEEAEKLISSLSELSILHIEADGVKSADDTVVNFTFTMLMDKLARILPNKETHLKGFHLLSQIEWIAEHPSFTLTDGKDASLLEAVLKYFKQKRSKKNSQPIFSLDNWNHNKALNHSPFSSLNIYKKTIANSSELKYWKSFTKDRKFWDLMEAKGHNQSSTRDEKALLALQSEEVRPAPKSIYLLRRQVLRSHFAAMFVKEKSIKQNHIDLLKGNFTFKEGRYEDRDGNQGSCIEVIVNGSPFDIGSLQEFKVLTLDPYTPNKKNELTGVAKRVSKFVLQRFTYDLNCHSDQTKDRFHQLTVIKERNPEQMEIDDFRHLFTMYANKSLQLLQLFNYMASHIHKLENPDYRDYFLKLFFQSKVLKKELIENPPTLEIIDETFKRILNQYKQVPGDTKFEISLFIYQLYDGLKSYAEEGALSNGQITQYLKLIPDTQKLRGQLLESAETAEQRQLISEHLIGGYSAQKELSEDEQNHLFCNLITYGSNSIDLLVKQRIAKAISVHGKTILAGISDPQHMNQKMNAVMKKLGHISNDLKWERKGQYIYAKTRTEEFLFNVDELRISIIGTGPNSQKVPLPRVLKQNPIVQEFFGSDMETLCTISLGTNQVEEYYIDSDLRVRKDGKQLFIDQQFDGDWYTYVHGKEYDKTQEYAYDIELYLEKARKALSSQSMNNNFKFFVPQTKPTDQLTLFFTPKKGEGLGKMVYKKHSNPTVSYTDSSRKTYFYLDANMNRELFKWLHDVEDRSYVDIWRDDNQIRKVSLPRFGMEFESSDTTPNHFVYNKDGRWHLPVDQSLDGLNKLPYKLLLENDKGEKQVLIPFGKIDVGLGSNFSSGKKIKNLLQAENHVAPHNSFKMEAFDYNLKTKQLESKTVEGNLYLAYIALAQREYALAQNYLEKASKNTKALSEKGQFIIDCILEFGDGHPHAVANKLLTYQILLENSETFPRLSRKELHKLKLNESEKGSFKALLNGLFSTYDTYLNFYNHQKEYALDKRSELKIVKYINLYSRVLGNDISLGNQINHRLEELMKVAHEKKSSQIDLSMRTLTDRIPLEDKNLSLYNEVDNFAREEGIFDLESHRLTFATKGFFKEKFLHLYFIALNNNHRSHARLETLLYNAIGDYYIPANKKENERKEDLKYALILYAVLKCPEKFEDFQGDFKFHLSHEENQNIRVKIDKIGEIAHKECQGVLPQYEKIQQKNELTPLVKVDNTLLVEELKNKIESNKKETREIAIPKVAAYDPILSGNPDYNAAKPQLQKDMQTAQNELDQLTDQILKRANRPSKDKQKKLKEKNAFLHDGKRNVTVDQLILYVMRKDKKLIQEVTHLDDQEINQLVSAVVNYMDKKARQQHRERLLAMIDGIEKCIDTNEKPLLIDDFNEHLKSVRVYDPQEHIAFLGFEVLSEKTGFSKMIRPVQIEKIRDLAFKDQLHYIAHSLMGTGKSTVIQELLSFIFAFQGDTLVISIVPSALLQSNREEAYDISKYCLGQNLEAAWFDRNYNKEMADGRGAEFDSIERLQVFHQKLLTAIAERQYIMLSKESLEALELKYVEMLDRYVNDADQSVTEEHIKLMEEILSLIFESGDPIFDEADTEFDTLKELVYTLGCRSPMNLDHIRTVTKVYKTLAMNEEFKKLIDIRSPEHPELGNGRIEEFLDKLALQAASNPEYAIVGDNQSLFVSYVRGREAKIPQCILDHPKKDELAILKHLLTDVLKLTLQKKGNVNYGNSRKHLTPGCTDNPFLLSVPYLASDTPNEQSRFGSTYEAICYTYQMILYMGLQPSIIKRWVDSLKQKIAEELENNPGMNIEQSEPYKEFARAVPHMNLYSVISEKHFQAIADHINAKGNEELLFDIAETHVLHKEMKEYLRKLSGNAQNLVDMFQKLRGFTGTPWNEKTYHKDLTTEVDNSLGEKTKDILRKDSKGEVYIFDTPQDSSTLVADLFSQYGDDFDALIDTGALFRGIPKEEVAKQILTINKRKDGVVFYDESNQIVVLERGKTTPVPIGQCKLDPKERFTFYDQRHCTGSDIKQHPTARAMQTLGNDTFERDMEQGAWRMRKLGKGQKVVFIIPKNIVELFPAGKIDIEEVITFCKKNQDERLKTLIFRSSMQKMKNIVRSHILKELRATRNLHEKTALYSGVAHELIEELPMNPWEMYGSCYEMISPTDFLKKYREKMVERIEKNSALSIDLKDRIVTALGEYKLPDAQDMPAEVPSKVDQSQGIEVETETEVETEVETETELEREQNLSVNDPTLIYTDWDKNLRPYIHSPTFFSPKLGFVQKVFAFFFRFTADAWLIDSLKPSMHKLTSVLGAFKKTKLFSNLFSPNIVVTDNYQMIHKTNTYPFDDYQKPIYQILIKRTPKLFFFTRQKYEVVIGDTTDVKFFKKGLIACNQEYAKLKGFKLWWRKVVNRYFERNQLCLYDLNLGIVQSGPFKITNEELKKSQEVQQMLAQVKFLNGEVQYTKDELKQIESWAKKSGAKEKMRKLFESHILPVHEENAGKYYNSKLQKVLTAAAA